MKKSGTMLRGGINNVAAALAFRRLATMGIEMSVYVSGAGMNHVLDVYLPDGRSWEITNARELFSAEKEMISGLR